MPEPLVVFTAVPTPFTDAGDVDHDAARRLFARVAATTGNLFVAGTTGEFPALDAAERLALVELALAEAGPDHVVAHVGAPDAYHAIAMARAAAERGTTRLAAITPYYLPASFAGVVEYYQRLREAVDVPELYAYLFPERTGVSVTPEQLATLAGIDGLTGAKLSGTPAEAFTEYAAAVPASFALYSGSDRDMARVAREGGRGVVSGVSAAYPEPFLALAAALAAREANTADADTGDTNSGAAGTNESDVDDAVTRVQRVVDQVVDALGPSIGRIRSALALRELAGRTARMPGAACTAETDHVAAELARALNTNDASRPEVPEDARHTAAG
jgi:dihydrodipicolinate synthase/N-acetylneuraminate lyase